jgi:outer membrane protein assembly factor BamB
MNFLLPYAAVNRHAAFVGSLAIYAGVFTMSAVSASDRWPQFRGAEAGAISDNPALPETWSTTDNVLWSLDVPGLGWSSPVVWGGQIFITSVVSSDKVTAPQPGIYPGSLPYNTKARHRWLVYSVDVATGKIRWQQEVRNIVPPEPKHLKNSFASETPVTDGERVYVHFANIGLFAFDMTGQPVWTHELEPVATRAGWGAGASPVLHKDRLYLVSDNDTRSFVAAFDRRSGKQVWRVARDEGSNWATPFVWENDLRTEIVTAGTDKVRSYDLDGKLLWELKGMTSITIPTPFARHGLLYISSGFALEPVRPVYAIRPGASGDISLKPGEASSNHIAWFQPRLGALSPSLLVYGDYLYTLDDRGFLSCNDARTGASIYARRRIAPADASGFTASPWAYNGRIFALSEDGDTFVIQAGPDFKLLGKNSLNDMALATPAVVQDSLILRTQSKLYRIAKSPAR